MLRNLKNISKILIITLMLVSCKKETEKNPEFLKSTFDLKTDLINFKKKMTEQDTINIWFNHAVCTYEGAERIEITKKSDSIHIRTEYKEDTFDQHPQWTVVYEKQLSITDTLWKIEDFFKRNKNRQQSEEKEYGILQVSHKEHKIHYFTEGLGDLNRFMIDYFDTMKKIHPENKNNIYGLEIPETKLIKDE